MDLPVIPNIRSDIPASLADSLSGSENEAVRLRPVLKG